MNNLKKILQMVVDYYNEVGNGLVHKFILGGTPAACDVLIHFLWELYYALITQRKATGASCEESLVFQSGN